MEMRATESIIEYARNPRKNDHAVDKIASAINEFGFRVPLIIKSDGSLVDGHLRLKAAKKLGLSEVPCLLADDLTEAQIKAFRLSVNKVSEYATWDFELLALELEELGELDFDISNLGFDDVINVNKVNAGNEDDEWVGMPEFEGKEKPYTVQIAFDGELIRNDFLEKFKDVIKFTVKQEGKYTWSAKYPYVENDDLSSVKYE